MRTLVLFTLAYVAGFAAFWAVTALQVMDLFETMTNSLVFLLMVPALGGLCVFALVYGLASGRMLKWRFWLAAPLGLALLCWAIIEMALGGWVTAYEGFLIALAVSYLAGLIACLRRESVVTS